MTNDIEKEVEVIINKRDNERGNISNDFVSKILSFDEMVIKEKELTRKSVLEIIDKITINAFKQFLVGENLISLEELEREYIHRSKIGIQEAVIECDTVEEFNVLMATKGYISKEEVARDYILKSDVKKSVEDISKALKGE